MFVFDTYATDSPRIVFFIVMNIIFRQFTSHSALLKVSDNNSTWKLEKETHKNLFVMRCLCLTLFSVIAPIVWRVLRERGLGCPLCQLDWVAASSEAFLNTSWPLLLHSFRTPSHSPLHFCCVCGLLLFCVCFSVFFSAANRTKVMWNFTPVAEAPPHCPLLFIECLSEQQLLLLSNEWNAIKLMSMHVYSV